MSAMRHLLAFLALLIACGPAIAAGQPVAMPGYQPGVILVRTGERHLYFTIGEGLALRYPVAVGRPGRQWWGQSWVSFKTLDPIWRPPEMVRRDKPYLPDFIGPGPQNPLGAAVLVLGDGRYGIHGTNKPSSIGTEASYGCIRMHNADVLELFGMVAPGTPVIVTR